MVSPNPSIYTLCEYAGFVGVARLILPSEPEQSNISAIVSNSVPRAGFPASSPAFLRSRDCCNAFSDGTSRDRRCISSMYVPLPSSFLSLSYRVFVLLIALSDGTGCEVRFGHHHLRLLLLLACPWRKLARRLVPCLVRRRLPHERLQLCMGS
jgi:hypothetical protein